MNLQWDRACGSWLCEMKEILSISIPLPLFLLSYLSGLWLLHALQILA